MTENIYVGKCPNCEFGVRVNRDSLTPLDPTWINFLKFIDKLPAFSETNLKIIKHEGKLRVEVDRLVEKIIIT